jgi:hypothetical protein
MFRTLREIERGIDLDLSEAPVTTGGICNSSPSAVDNLQLTKWNVHLGWSSGRGEFHQTKVDFVARNSWEGIFMKSKLHTLFSAACCTVMLSFGSANANTIVGDTISGEFDAPLGSPVGFWLVVPNSTFTVGNGIEGAFTTTGALQLGIPDLFSFDFSAHQLVITFDTGQSYNTDSFSGPVFSIISGNPFDTISSVSGCPPSALVRQI